MRLRSALGVALAMLMLCAPSATAREMDAVKPEAVAVNSPKAQPPGYSLNAGRAVSIANRVRRVREERTRHPDLSFSVAIPVYEGVRHWQVRYESGGDGIVEVHVDGRSGRVVEVWTGPQVDYLAARGQGPPVGRSLNKAYIWIPLALLFLAPFLDPRRPFRLLHLDLLVLLGFGLSQLFFNAGNVSVSVPIVYPFLGYLLVRLLLAGFRPRGSAGRLVPYAPTAVLAIGLMLLVGGRVALNIVDSNVIDVGYASVVGADRIAHKEELYVLNETHGDSYGPVNYVAYIPFELALPWHGKWDRVPAAHAAAITFDILTLLGLVLLGARLRRGREGRRLGLALGYAWAAYPFSTYVLQSNTNDGLLAMLLVGSLLALQSAPARGALLALGTAAKFVPLVLAPLFAPGLGDRRPLSLLRFASVFALVLVVAALAYMPDGGPRELYDTTIGFQLGRASPLSLWGLHPSLEWLQLVVKLAAVALAGALAFVPRRRDLRQVAALGAAVIIAFQLAGAHWFYFYLVWFAPFALVAILGAYGAPSTDQPAPVPASRRELEPALT